MESKRRWALAAALLVAGAAAAQTVVYVKTPTAEVRKGTSVTGPVVEKVVRGTALNVVGADKMRFEVRTPAGNVGFISRMKVSEDPPDTGGGALGGLVIADRGPSEMRTSTSGRGLAPVIEEGAATDEAKAAAIESVKQMEATAAAITEADVEAFLTEGGMNP